MRLVDGGNEYLYVQNRPVRLLDSDGLLGIPIGVGMPCASLQANLAKAVFANWVGSSNGDGDALRHYFLMCNTTQRCGGLNLRFLVDAQHEGFVGRVEMEAHHVGHLLHEAMVRGQLEGFRAVGLQPAAGPEPLDRGVAYRLGLRHGPRAPVRCPLGLGLDGGRQGLRDLRLWDGGLSPPARRIVEECIGTTRHVPLK